VTYSKPTIEDLRTEPVYLEGPSPARLRTALQSATVANYRRVDGRWRLAVREGRPGVLLRAIARPEDQETLAQLIFAETSTLGLRIYRAERRVEARHTVEVETPHGKVRVKVSNEGHYAPEYEDCRRLAIETKTPLKDIIAEANLAYLRCKTNTI